MDPNTNYANYGGYAPAPAPVNAQPPSKGKRILIVVGGGIVLISILMVVFSHIFGGSSAKEQIITAAASQQEIVRVATLIEETRSADSATRNIAMITKLTATSNYTDLIQHLESAYDSKPKGELLKTAVDEQSDGKINSADQNNTLDTTFKSIMVPLLRSAITATTEALDTNNQEDTEAILTRIQEKNTLLLNFFNEE